MPSVGYGYYFDDADNGARKLEKAYLRTPPGVRELFKSGGSTGEFGSEIRPKRSKDMFTSNSVGSVPTCGYGVEERSEPLRYWAPGPGSYDPQTCRNGGSRLGQDSPYANYAFSQADNGPKDGPEPGRASVGSKDPQYGCGRLGGLKGLQTPTVAETISPGPKYMIRSEPHLNKKNPATDVTCTYGPRYNFDKSEKRANSQGAFATHFVKGLGGGFGRDSCLDNPGPADYSPKVHRGGGGHLGDTAKVSFKGCRPHDAYGRPGKTRVFSEQHSAIDNHGIYTQGPAYYDTMKIYATSRTREPDSSRVKYSMRPKLRMEFDEHVKKATNPGPGMYDPACSRNGKSLAIDSQQGCKIGTQKKFFPADEEPNIPYLSTQHEMELAGKFSPGPVYDPPNQSIAADAGITNVSPPRGKPAPSSRSKGFSFGSSSRFEKDHGGFETGHLWERKFHGYSRERPSPKPRREPIPPMEGTSPSAEEPSEPAAEEA